MFCEWQISIILQKVINEISFVNTQSKHAVEIFCIDVDFIGIS